MANGDDPGFADEQAHAELYELIAAHVAERPRERDDVPAETKPDPS